MRKFLLMFTIATAGAFNSYSFGIGVEGGYGGSWATNDFNLGHGAAVGLSLGFGDITDPFGFLGINFDFRNRGWGILGNYDFAIVNYPVTSWFLIQV